MIIEFNNTDSGSVSVKIKYLYHCTDCQYFGREYENNDIRCNCRNSPYYLDVPPGEPCNYWESKA